MHIPLATYRIQFTPRFGFHDACEAAAYLAALGISDLYASPVFKARRGSMHGYDVVDPNQLNDELGSRSDFDELRARLRELGMGWIQDFVPNHMAFSAENPMLMDVVEYGEKSPFHSFFDIIWDHPYESLKGRLLAPFLGKFYAQTLNDNEIRLNYDEGGLFIACYDLRFPLSLKSYRQVLLRDIGRIETALGRGNPRLMGFLGTVDLLTADALGDGAPRFEQIAHAKRMLWKMYFTDAEIKEYVDAGVRSFNGQKDNPSSFDNLDDLLSKQFFRLSFWKVASEELNYRRFFSINDLISLNVEDPAVFRHTHDFVLRASAEGVFDGLRIDHIDGLYDPAGYLRRLRGELPESFIVVEKILSAHESLPPWPVQGTTGYDFLNQVNGLFCDKRNAGAFSSLYVKSIRREADFGEIVYESKRAIIGRHMAGDIDNLAHLMKSAASNHRYGRDITLYGLRAALVEVMAAFPVYRGYIDDWRIGDIDAAFMGAAIEKARTRVPPLLYELDFIEQFLLLRFREPLTENEKTPLLHFVMRFQQYTGPLMAKGFEDTALYVYNRLISLNDVGGNPATFGVSPAEFHSWMTRRGAAWPYSLNASATHDTKRGEDARARINVLSEMPDEWARRCKQWRKLNKAGRTMLHSRRAPDANDEYLIYQTLVGAFPFDEDEFPSFVERMKAYTIKAIREAKVHTTWIKTDDEYENACLAFVSSLLSSPDNPFMRDFAPFCTKIAFYGVFNSLSQTLIKIASPGIPDFYQGTELWDLSLVDPDNRRPVDFRTRRRLLEDIEEQAARNLDVLIADLLSAKEDGRIKLFLIWRALGVRKQHEKLFREGAYIALETRGIHAESIFAFARKSDDEWAVAAAPRLLTPVVKEGEYPLGKEVWSDTVIRLPPEAPPAWREAFSERPLTASDGCISAGEALSGFPVSLCIAKKE